MRAVEGQKRDGVWMEISHAQTEAYHGSMDVPEGSLLAVQDLPLGFILFPVNPADEISQCEKYSAQLSWHQHYIDVAVESG